MSLNLSNYEDRAKHRADISKLTLTANERKRWIRILEELTMNDGSSEDKAMVLSLLNGSKSERNTVDFSDGEQIIHGVLQGAFSSNIESSLLLFYIYTQFTPYGQWTVDSDKELSHLSVKGQHTVSTYKTRCSVAYQEPYKS